jgi:hypothetical protein
MTAFRALYPINSFKSAFDQLVNLDSSDHPAVAEAARSSAVRSSDSLVPAASALRTIRQIVSQESLESVLGDIEELCPPGTIEKLGDLVDVLQPTEEERDDDYAEDVERTALPFLLHPYIYCDLRATDWRETGEIKFAPVAIVRLNFDEVVGGGEAVSFQMGMRNLRALRDEIDSAIELINRAVQSLPADSVPRYYREWMETGSD